MRNIFLFSVIDEYSAQYTVQQLLDYDRESSDEITMFINSPGGSVIQGLAIIDAMRIIKSPVRTVVTGIAASMAAVIASCGKERLITPTAQFMIHEASWAAWGSISSMAETVEQGKKLNDLIVGILAKNSNKSENEVRSTMEKKDKYFTAQEAAQFGLCDRVINDQEAQSLKLSESINVEGYEIKGKEIQMLRDGEYVHPIYGHISITESVLNKMKDNFDKNVRGCDISIDYTHDNDNGESPAAFWIKSLVIRQNDDGKGKGLFAVGEFTPKGAKKVSEKEYKYSSADFRIDYVDQHGKHHPYVLCGGTLTNRPFIKNMNPIKLSEKYKKEAKTMNKDELIAALKDCGIDVSALLAGSESLTARIKELEAKIVELNSLPVQKEAEIKSLKDKLEEANAKIVESEKVKAFNALVSEGKCIPAQKDEVFKAFKTAEEIQSFFKNAPVVVSMKPAGQSGDSNADELTDEEKMLIEKGEFTKEEILSGRLPVKKETTAK